MLYMQSIYAIYICNLDMQSKYAIYIYICNLYMAGPSWAAWASWAGATGWA